MIIDCHAHIQDAEDTRLTEILHHADLAEVDVICISSLGREWVEFPSSETLEVAATDVVAACTKHPDRFVGLTYLSADHVELSLALLDRTIVNGPCRAIKLWVSQLADDPRLGPIYDRAIELDVPILQHTWTKATGNMSHESTYDHVVNAAKERPELRIWIAHAGGRWEEAARVIKDCPNVCVDISGGEPEDGIVECLVAGLGVERVFYGSDIPGRSFVVQMTKVLAADIPEEHKHLILGGNIRRWIPL